MKASNATLAIVALVMAQKETSILNSYTLQFTPPQIASYPYTSFNVRLNDGIVSLVPRDNYSIDTLNKRASICFIVRHASLASCYQRVPTLNGYLFLSLFSHLVL